MMTVENLLNRAADAEIKMLAATDDIERAKHKRMANIAFRKAMHGEAGDASYNENILGD